LTESRGGQNTQQLPPEFVIPNAERSQIELFDGIETGPYSQLFTTMVMMGSFAAAAISYNLMTTTASSAGATVIIAANADVGVGIATAQLNAVLGKVA